MNGGGVFGVCTVASNCLPGSSSGFLGGEMWAPADVAVDASGNVYVADKAAADHNRIQRFDSAGAWQRLWGKNANGGGGFEVCTVASSCGAGMTGGLGGEMCNPHGVAVDSAGNVYVGDSCNNRVQRFGSSGAWARAWGRDVNAGGGVFGICTVASSCLMGTTGGLGGEMNNPLGVATDSAGNVYVADAGNNRIQKFDSAGTWQRAWGRDVNAGGGVFGICTAAMSCLTGTTGGLGGEMNGPTDVATDSAGNVYVADAGNNRIQKFDSSGNWQRAWGKNLNGGGVFEVCTVAANCFAGTTGGLGGEMNAPIGVGTDSAGNLYVAEFGNNRVQKFADPVVPPAPGPTPSPAPSITSAPGPTGKRAAALKKCRKKRGAARAKCRRNAKKLPV